MKHLLNDLTIHPIGEKAEDILSDEQRDSGEIGKVLKRLKELDDESSEFYITRDPYLQQRDRTVTHSPPYLRSPQRSSQGRPPQKQNPCSIMGIQSLSVAPPLVPSVKGIVHLCDD
jgi:hypothetical protein